MKKTNLLSSVTTLLCASTLYGQSITINDGWQLKGATENITNMTTAFNNKCIDYVWAYDSNGWKVHAGNGNTISSIASLTTISQADGFWIKGNGSCTVDTNTAAIETPETTSPNYTGTWIGTTSVDVPGAASTCNWNVSIVIGSDDSAVTSATLTSATGLGAAECDGISNSQGSISNKTESGFTYVINNTNSDYIYGGSTFNMSVSGSNATETKNFSLEGYSATRTTSISKQ